MRPNNTIENGRAYLSTVIRLYLELPETPSRAGRNDRNSAAHLPECGIHLTTVESALLLASLRRLGRSSEIPPLAPIRSLAYFFR